MVVYRRQNEVKRYSCNSELIAKEPYVQAYINFFFGNVIKSGIEELRQNRSESLQTVLYHSFSVQAYQLENYKVR